MVYPLLPLFIVGALGASATALGWVEGVAMALIAAMTAWAGWRSDGARSGHARRVPWIRWGYGLPVIGKSILAVSTVWPLAMLGRAIDRFGKGLRGSPRDALIADASLPEQRGRCFGFHRAMDTAGATLGVLLAAGLLWWLAGVPDAGSTPELAADHAPETYHTVFAIAAAMGLMALVLTFLIRERPAESHAASRIAEQTKPLPPGTEPIPRSYWLTLAVLLVFAVANSSDTFLLLRARDVGLSPWAVVLAYALCNIVYAAASYPAGAFSDRIGRWRVIALGWVLYAGIYAGFALTGPSGIWPLMALYGLYLALTDGVGKALISDHAPPGRRGAALGIFSMALGLTTLASSVLAGVLWDHAGHEWPFLIGCTASLAALLLLPIVARATRSATDVPRPGVAPPPHP
ncbi:MAG: MFS transporter [Phycisphaeraceae bacterium]|nr:MFS transporter [Phycisphaeraceae bacterium]